MAAPQISLLAAADRDFLHERILGVLEKTGARFESRAARRVLAAVGCAVDGGTEIVRFPPALVEDTIASLPRRVLLAGREARRDALLDGSRTYLASAGISPCVLTPEGGYREATFADLAEATRLADALDEVGVVWMAVSPTGGAGHEGADLGALACLLANTGKHVQGQLVRPQDVPPALAMLQAAAPDGDLRRRPIFSSLYCPVSPLTHAAQPCEAAMLMAQAGIPLAVFSLSLAGATSPLTLAGTIIQTMAEQLSAAVLFAAVAPGCPLLLASNSGVMDMATSRFVTSTPGTILMNLAEIELVHSYGVPTLSVGHVTDAPDLGFRAGLEDMALALLTRLARPDIMIGLGTVAAGQAFSPAKLVLDAEAARHNEHILAGIALDDEHAATSIIAGVGPGGEFLTQRHTRRFLRGGEHWQPRLLQRRGHQERCPRVSDELQQAAARAQEILGAHAPVPLSARAAGTIAAILREAGEERDRQS